MLSPNSNLKFSVLGIDVEIEATNPARLAEPFDYFTGRPRSGSSLGKLILRQTTRAFREADRRPRSLTLGASLLLPERRENESSGHLIGKGAKAETLGQSFLKAETTRLLARAHWHHLPALGFGYGKKAALVFLGKGLDPSAFALSCLEREGSVFLGHPFLGPFGQLSPFPLAMNSFKPSELPSRWLPHPDETFRPRHLVWAELGGDRAAELAPLPRWLGASKLALSLRPKRVAELFGPDAWGQLSRTTASALLLAQSDAHRLLCKKAPRENADALIETLRAIETGKAAPLRLG